jgi:CBS domain-containing protein
MTDTARTTAVGPLVHAAVATIGPSATLRDAVEALASDGLGLLVVVDATGVQGVISERDVIAAVAEGLELDVERVRDHCADDIVSVDEDTSVEDAARTMAGAGIRHLAVSRGGDIFGVVSIRDVLTVLIDT